MKKRLHRLWLLSSHHRLGIGGVVILGVLNVGLGLYFIWVCKGVIDIATSGQGEGVYAAGGGSGSIADSSQQSAC